MVLFISNHTLLIPVVYSCVSLHSCETAPQNSAWNEAAQGLVETYQYDGRYADEDETSKGRCDIMCGCVL